MILGITCPRSPRKPGVRQRAPFKDWVLPAAMERVRRKLAGADDGNRQMVDILTTRSPTGCQRSRLLVRKRSPTACIPPM